MGKKEASGPRGPFGPLGPLDPLVLWVLGSSGSSPLLDTLDPLDPLCPQVLWSSGSSSYRVIVGSLMFSPDHQWPLSVSTTENGHEVGVRLWTQSLLWVFWNLPYNP